MTNNVFEFPDARAIEDEARTWLVKLDGDAAPTADELAALREWLSRSPAHREELARIARFWGKLNVLTELAVPPAQTANVRNRDAFGSLREPRPRTRLAGLLAASVLVAAAIAALSIDFSRPDPEPFDSNGLYATAVGQQQATTLADGSVVLLNTNSQIRVEYNAAYRNIWLLQGEAHFTVTPDPEFPFRVYVGNRRVQALGTSFSIYLRRDVVDVTVTEGSVALASVREPPVDAAASRDPRAGESQMSGESAGIDDRIAESLAVLRAGESATIQRGAAVDSMTSPDTVRMADPGDIVKRLSWREGMLSFAGDPLVDVVAEISRYTTVSIEIEDPEIRAMRIGGRFPIGETDAMFDSLEANFGLRITRLGPGRVLLSMAGD